MSLEILSRIQFGFTISFHILFPAFSIGLVTFIALFEAAWLKTRKILYLSICKFWTKILALTFGMGIVSGIVMEFQLGTNWSNFTQTVGDVLGALFTYEVLTAFFIEAGFLGVMFFGWNRVSPRLHFAATLLALIGVTLSAFWIMSANSWMQSPAGVSFNGNDFKVTEWSSVIFNPVFMPRFMHMLLSTYISSFLVIAAVSAYFLLKKIHLDFARKCFSFVMWALLILLPLQIAVGDEVGLRVHQYQPIKTAALEAVWHTERGAPLVLFAWPNEKTERNDYAIQIPKLGSWLNTRDLNGELVGLTSVSKTDRPPVPIVFYSFRIMVGFGLLILLLAVIACVLRLKRKLFDTPWFLKCCIYAAPLGFISIIMGWFTAEFGRQPWVVYQFLRTANALSPVSVKHVLSSLLMIVFVYGVIFGYFYFRYFIKAIKKGPEIIPSELKTELEGSFYYMSPSIAKLETRKPDS